MVCNATALPNWRSVIPVRSRWEESPVPIQANQILELRDRRSTLLAIEPEGLRLICHFFDESEIKLDFDVRDLRIGQCGEEVAVQQT